MQKKRKAREKIKNHILKYGKCKNFTITKRLLTYWFGVLNLAIFDGKLSRPNFNIKHINKAWADCCGEYLINKNGAKEFNTDGSEAIEITISLDSNKIENNTREVLIAALVHEMVHAWQFEYRTDIVFEKRMSHGSTFLQWREAIENVVGVKIGFDIDENDVTVHGLN